MAGGHEWRLLRTINLPPGPQLLPPQKANDVAREAWQALQHIYGLGVLETPLLRSPNLEAACTSCRVHLKLESSQATGSFKLRGATHALASLGGAGRVVTASTGNHALATVQAARALASRPEAPALEPVIFLPNTVTPGKARRLEALGATLRYAGDDCCDTEAAARAAAAAERCPYVSPYNDLRVAGGQGTVAFELLMALPRLHAVYVPVGGGGLVSGIASVLKAVDPCIKVIGCQPSASAVMAASVEAGRLLQDVISTETLSGATAGACSGVARGGTWERNGGWGTTMVAGLLGLPPGPVYSQLATAAVSSSPGCLVCYRTWHARAKQAHA